MSIKFNLSTILLFLLFAAFCLPDANLMLFSVGGIFITLKEVVLILFILFYWLLPLHCHVVDFRTRNLIRLFLFCIVFNELLKVLVYDQSLFNAIKSLRTGLPLISAMVILLAGVRLPPLMAVKVLCWSLMTSFLLTGVFYILRLEFQYVTASGVETFSSLQQSGRFFNQNFEFSILGLTFLLFEWPKLKKPEKSVYRFLASTSILALIAAALAFNRTVYIGILIIVAVSLFKRNSASALIRATAICVSLLSILYYLYHTNPAISRQIDKRIVSVIEGGQQHLAANVLENNRDVLYEQYLENVKVFWALGIPMEKPLSITFDRKTLERRALGTSDIGLLNIWMRYGLLSLIFFIMIFYYSFVTHKTLIIGSGWNVIKYSAIVFFILSFNIDTLVKHNAIILLSLMATFYPTMVMSKRLELRQSI